MRKCLLLVALLAVSQFSLTNAQSIFEAPDTVCVRQPVQLKTLKPDAKSHYWGFCSAYLLNNPVGKKFSNTVPADSLGLQQPTATEIVKQDGKYYGFVVNTNSREFLQLNYGTSLESTPKVINYGDMDNVLPELVNSIYVVQDEADSNWYIFLAAGDIGNNSRLARIDYGKSFENTPNIVNFGNIKNMLNVPTGLFVEKEGNKWYGFFFNRAEDKFYRLDMDTNISKTPDVVDLGNIPGGALSAPVDLAPIIDNGDWYFFVTNRDNNSITRVEMGASLTNPAPTGVNIGTIDNELDQPSGISLIRDCGALYAFVLNRGSHDLIRVDMPSVLGPYTSYQNFNNVGNILGPTSLSTIIRDRDNLYMFATNIADSSYSRIKFQQCANTNIQYSLSKNPPEYRYNTPGLYNIYYAINEGRPDMEVQCKLIRVLPIPDMEVSNDTTICQGDTIELKILSINSFSYNWYPDYNISNTSKTFVKVWPEYTVNYRITLPFPAGCIVDTGITVTVRKVKADAGPDRTLVDGASTMLGGPNTMNGTNFTYTWQPNQYLDNMFSKNPIARPPFDFTYYLRVGDTSGCYDIDTVIVRVGCNDLNLPNAFQPESRGLRSKFGLVNSQIVKLNYFTIHDRWGQEVFTTTDPTKQWDGTINGEPAPMGVYVWQADGFCNSGKRLQSSGNVTLIR